jgi:Flp pilus assembly protein TadD
VLLVIYDLIFRRPRRSALLRDVVDRATGLLPTALAVLTYLYLRTLVLGGATRVQEINPTDNRLVLLEGGERLGTALGITARYLRLFFAPFGLSADRSGGVVTPEGVVSIRALAGLGALLALVLLALLPWIRASVRRFASGVGPVHAAAFGAWLFLLPYLPGSNLFFLVRATVAERVLYLPSAGLCLIAGAAACALTARVAKPRIVTGAWLAACALLAVLTWRQCGTWKNDESAFSAALRNAPGSPRAAFILAKVRQDQGRHDEALALFERARTVWPDFVGAWVDAASELARAKRFGEAESRLREALVRFPDYGGAHHNLGVLLRQRGRIAEAERSLRKATIYDAALHRAWAELGHLYFDAGRFADAARCYERAVALGREDLAPRLREARSQARAGA